MTAKVLKFCIQAMKIIDSEYQWVKIRLVCSVPINSYTTLQLL